MKKEVKIIGLSLNERMGILEAHRLELDPEKRLFLIKGAVGAGKTTEQTALQLGTQGSKTLIDNKLYGNINLETQLLDGETSLWIGCKSDDKGKLSYVLYSKDSNGKKVENPVIDGDSATPADYLKRLQTELTWRMDELTSENPTVQKKILLKLYQHQLIKHGVIFDEKHPEYSGSILDLIKQAEADRDNKDFLRKQLGGIKDDLVKQGFDPDRPATCPDEIDVSSIETKIRELEKEKTTLEVKAESGKAERLEKIKSEAAGLVNECLVFNSKQEKAYNVVKERYEKDVSEQIKIDAQLLKIDEVANTLLEMNVVSSETLEHLGIFINGVVKTDPGEEPKKPSLIRFNEKNQPIIEDHVNSEANELLQKVGEKREAYFSVLNSESEEVNTTEIDAKIDLHKAEIENAAFNNKIVKAIDSFHNWRDCNDTVLELKNKYAKLLASVDTGVDGLRIQAEETNSKLDLFLMYNGAYSPDYFNNLDGEYRKLSSYSGTQKPVICLLIQKYLLDLKPKAMRYMYIDNIPVDDKTLELLESMCEDLDLRIIMNITGTFSKDNIKKGEVLIEGGQIFFNN